MSFGDGAKHDGDTIDVDGDYIGRDSKITNPTPKEKEPWYKKWQAILTIVVAVIGILGFFGIKQHTDIFGKKPNLPTATQSNTPSDSKLRIDPNRVDANMPVSKPSGG